MNGRTTLVAEQVIVITALLLAGAAANAIADGTPGSSPVRQSQMHEAFAAPSGKLANPGEIISSKPPQTLLEAPPAIKPSQSAAWLPGYWSWESTSGKYVWVSAAWRIAPPGMRWLPGYWSQAKEGWRWVGGFWFPANEPHLQYLPDPPPAKDERPSKTSADHFIVRGYWSYADGRYVWKPGFEAQSKPGWLWIQAHYVWSPRGSIFVPGYWDYSIGRRGEGFALPRAASLRRANSHVGAAEAANKLVRLRQQFETGGDAANATGPATLDLPADSSTNQRNVGVDRVTTEESLPGVVGRRVPGVRQRTLPGVPGRRVPGVEADLPEVAAPGVDPREISPR